MAKKRTLEKIQLEMKDTLESMGCMEVVSASSRNGDVRFLCRVTEEPIWLKILSEYLASEADWYSFIGKKYFLNEGRLVFGWVLIFESEEIDKTTQDVRKLFLKCSNLVQSLQKKEERELDRGEIEIPLPSSAGFQKRLQKRVTTIS